MILFLFYSNGLSNKVIRINIQSLETGASLVLGVCAALQTTLMSYKASQWNRDSDIRSFVYYRIRPNYRTYPYKRIVEKFRSLQITASELFLYFFIKAYVVGTHLNCIDLSMQFKWVPTTYAFINKLEKNA